MYIWIEKKQERTLHTTRKKENGHITIKYRDVHYTFGYLYLNILKSI
jgi:hypothetical protein